jgi:hypothetical protein
VGLVNSQRENGPKEREIDLTPGYRGQQLGAEKSFISRTLAERPLPEREFQPLIVGGSRATAVEHSLFYISMT